MNEEEILKTLNTEITSHINLTFDDIEKGYDAKMKKNRIKKITLGLVASFAIFSTAAFGIYYYTPQAYVSIDINPSIELETNFLDKVIGTNGANEDALEVLSSVDIKNQPIDEAIKTIVEETVEQGYIDEEKENAVLITVSTDDEEKSETIDEIVTESVEEVLEETNQEAEIIDVVTKKNQTQVKQKAQELGISVGKANVIDNIIRKANLDGETELTYEELKDLSVKDIVHLYKSNKNKAKDIIDEIEDTLDNIDDEEDVKEDIAEREKENKEKAKEKEQERVEKAKEQKDKYQNNKDDENRPQIAQGNKENNDKPQTAQGNKENNDRPQTAQDNKVDDDDRPERQQNNKDNDDENDRPQMAQGNKDNDDDDDDDKPGKQNSGNDKSSNSNRPSSSNSNSSNGRKK